MSGRPRRSRLLDQRWSGLSAPDRAPLIRDDGLDATYLASNLRPGQPDPEGGPGRSVTDRLAELESLKQHGLVTRAEYDERRAAILGSL